MRTGLYKDELLVGIQGSSVVLDIPYIFHAVKPHPKYYYTHEQVWMVEELIAHRNRYKRRAQKTQSHPSWAILVR
jgi:hypothetical protein